MKTELRRARFGTHGHRDMEIVNCVLFGELAHKDSMSSGQPSAMGLNGTPAAPVKRRLADPQPMLNARGRDILLHSR